eukprot:8643709-Pyramimonas_sp.AAC.1
MEVRTGRGSRAHAQRGARGEAAVISTPGPHERRMTGRSTTAIFSARRKRRLKPKACKYLRGKRSSRAGAFSKDAVKLCKAGAAECGLLVR